MSGGRGPKRRGYYYEKRMEAKLAPAGFKRMPMSGALGGVYSGDLQRPSGKMLCRIEVKRRKGGQRRLRRWLSQGDAQALLLPGGRSEDDLAVLPLALLCILLDEAKYGRA